MRDEKSASKIFAFVFFFSPGALELLGNEIVPNTPPAAASAQYRKSLAISLFYKVDTSNICADMS